MSADEIWKFLDSKTKLFVAFPTKDEFPHVSPVWFCILDKKIYLRTHDYKVKTGLARSGKACCSIDEGESYKELRGIIIWGRSRVITERGLLEKVNSIMNEKYKDLQWMEEEMPKSWVEERRKENRAFIEIIPMKISSWDNGKV
jgi:nitroimidazol reductase NimA-like FMN-containing flavoprotein (pyridoxamine 5'-phosphate oxidase superfamily)